MEETMVDLGRRPLGRLFCFAVAAMAAAFCFGLTAAAAPLPQSGGTTTVADTVLLADGTPAQGNLIISWPAFETTSGTAVVAGVTTTALGTGGALSIGLIPNVGATPAGAYYTVVYQLGPGEVKTEYWLVPTTSPANLATVRTTPGTGTAAQPVSIQYVNSQLATKANDNSVVHLGGTETISGTKTFASAPTVPNPTSTSQVANKAYVDGTVACLNASTWAKGSGQTSTTAPRP
jgi:trimeric autotransporter adhesin